MTRERLLAFLLRHANRLPPSVRREEFYALKDRLLRRHGTLEGYDLQHIKDLCWGFPEDDGCPGEACGKCGGTGIHREFWVSLARWRWRGHVFHKPTIRHYTEPLPHIFEGAEKLIEGRIDHAPRSRRACSEARLWLYLVAGEWRLLWLAMRGSWVTPGPWPLLNLQRLIFSVRGVVGYRSVCSCGRRFWNRGKMHSFYCRRCLASHRRQRLAWHEGLEDDDIPF